MRQAETFIKFHAPLIAFAASFPVRNDKPVVGLNEPSSVAKRMLPYWDKVGAIVSGTDAIRAAGTTYLPKLPHEAKPDYDWRLQNSKFTNVYRDIIENLASRPFQTDVTVNEAPSQIEEFVDDVDGAGNSLTQFAADWFFNGINDAIDWVFIDYPDAPANGARTVAAEKAAGLRPFWSRVVARNMLELHSSVINGAETITYARIWEPDVDGNNYVRILLRDETGTIRWQLWREDKTGGVRIGDNSPREFVFDREGIITIDVIPLVPFITGRRNGHKWVFHPPMRDAADLQIKLYQEESGLDYIANMAAFPMLAGNGVKPPAKDPANPNSELARAPVGPMAVLYAPPDGKGASGQWALLEPSATSMTFLQAKIEKTILQLRELGRQPLTAQSGNLTVITTAVAAQKGNSAVKMWAFAMKNAIAEALIITAKWLALKDYTNPKVVLFTDFDVDGEGGEVLSTLTTMRTNGDISQRTLWKEMKRRNVLSPEFDEDDEEDALLNETPGDDEDLDAQGNVVPMKKPAKPGKAPGSGQPAA